MDHPTVAHIRADIPIQRVQTIERFAHATGLNGSKDFALPI